jgi:hypothetical protein
VADAARGADDQCGRHGVLLLVMPGARGALGKNLQ